MLYSGILYVHNMNWVFSFESFLSSCHVRARSFSRSLLSVEILSLDLESFRSDATWRDTSLSQSSIRCNKLTPSRSADPTHDVMTSRLTAKILRLHKHLSCLANWDENIHRKILTKAVTSGGIRANWIRRKAKQDDCIKSKPRRRSGIR